MIHIESYHSVEDYYSNPENNFKYQGENYDNIFIKGNSAYLYSTSTESESGVEIIKSVSPFELKEIIQTGVVGSVVYESIIEGKANQYKFGREEINEAFNRENYDFDKYIEEEVYNTQNVYGEVPEILLKTYENEFNIINPEYADGEEVSHIPLYYEINVIPRYVNVLLTLDNNRVIPNLMEKILDLYDHDRIKQIIPYLSEKNALLLFEQIQKNTSDQKFNNLILSQFIKEYKILDQISKSSLYPYSVEAAAKCEFNESLAFAYKDSVKDVLILKDNSEYLAYFLKNSIDMDVLKACLIDVANLTQTVKDYPNLEKIAKNIQIENLTVGNKIKFQSKDGVVELPFNQVLALIKQNPVNAQNLIDKNEYVEQLAIKSSPSAAKILPDMTPDQQILFYNEHRHLSSLIKNPSVELQVHAVKQNPNHIALFKNPCEQAQIVSVQQFPRNIALIENPCEIAQNIAVKKDPETLNLIDSPLESVKKIAVLELPSMIASIDNPSEELRDLSLRNGYSIFHLDNPTEKEIEKAIFNSPELIEQFPKSVQNLTSAHNSNPDIVEYLSFSSPDEIKNAIIVTKYYTGREDAPVPPIFINKEIQNLSLEHSGGVTFSRFKHLCDDQTIEKAVSLLPSNIKHVESPSPKLQMMAIEKDPSCISYIKNPDKVVEIRAGALSMIQKVEFNKETERKLGNDNNLSNDMGIKL